MNGHDMSSMGPGPGFWLLTLLIIAGAGYLGGVHRLLGRGDSWPSTRSLAAGGGLFCLAVAVLPAPDAAATFPAHVVQHLLMTMLGPLLLALSAPITLALRVLPKTGRRVVMVILHSRVSGLLTTAPVVLVLNVGALYGYYLTPLFSIAHQQPLLQGLVHLHMFLAGCLLSWYVVGRDPMARRPSTPNSLSVLFIAAVAHDVLAKLLYANGLSITGGASEQLQVGAQLMYYGGNIIEVLTATVLMSTWYSREGRVLRHERRRTRAGIRDG